MLIKPDFEKCKQAARTLLMRQNLDNLRIIAAELSFDRPIIFDSIQNYEDATRAYLPPLFQSQRIMDGGTLVYNGRYIVLYDARERDLRRLNWTLAHELGHIYLGHRRDDDISQIEAHFFAAELLAPECALLELRKQKNTLTYFDIYDAFFITYTAARKRLATLNSGRQTSVCDPLSDMLEPCVSEFVREPARFVF